jgi:hypothetical protein
VPVTFTEFVRDTQQIGYGVQVGIGDWQTRLETNKQSYCLAFVQCAEFLVAFAGEMTAVEFVNKLDLNSGAILSAAKRSTFDPSPGEWFI